MTTITEAKASLRQSVRLAVSAIPELRRKKLSADACSLLVRQKVWLESASILFYAPLSGEIDIWPLLEESLASGKKVALPRFDVERLRYTACEVRDIGRDVVAGRYGIREPGAACEETTLNRLDLVLVPGVAFDPHGRRLGRGKGYYDQLLALVGGATCGVAFDEQIVSEIPVEPHDIHLRCILTPTRWLEP